MAEYANAFFIAAFASFPIMQMDLTLERFLSLILAVTLGAIVGIEREITHKPAGLRTQMLVLLGSCLFTVVLAGFYMDPP